MQASSWAIHTFRRRRGPGRCCPARRSPRDSRLARIAQPRWCRTRRGCAWPRSIRARARRPRIAAAPRRPTEPCVSVSMAASCVTCSMRGSSAVSAKAERSRGTSAGGALGRLRTCHWNSQCLGHDVGRGAAFDGADADGRVGRLEARVALLRGDVGAEALKLADQRRGGGDGVDPDLGHARMRFAAGDARTVGVDALMRIDHLHAGRLADDGGTGPWQVGAKPGDQRAHAGAAHLLVIRDDDVDRLLQLAH